LEVSSISIALGVDDLAGIAKNVVEPVLPVLDITVVDGATLGWGRLINRSSHCLYWGIKKR
jgi:hypothetical protein